MAPCPKKAPIFNGSKCVTCPNGDYFVIENSTCYSPEKVSNVTALKDQEKAVEDENNTLEDLKDAIEKSELPTEICPEEKPVASNNGTECKAIP